VRASFVSILFMYSIMLARACNVNIKRLYGRFIDLYATFAPSPFCCLLAILLRCCGQAGGPAMPPVDAPSFDSATAAGFLTRSGGSSPLLARYCSISDSPTRIASRGVSSIFACS